MHITLYEVKLMKQVEIEGEPLDDDSWEPHDEITVKAEDAEQAIKAAKASIIGQDVSWEDESEGVKYKATIVDARVETVDRRTIVWELTA